MTFAIILSVLTGTLIGFRFKIFMVMPAIIVTAAATAIVTVTQGETFWAVITAVGLSAAAVQIGYLCGSFALSQKEAPLPAPNTAADSYQAQAGIPVRFSDR